MLSEGEKKGKKRRKEEKEEKKGRERREKGRKGEKKGRKRKGKEGKGEYEDSVGGCVGRFFFSKSPVVKNSGVSPSFRKRCAVTAKDAPSEPLRNPPSYARKLPVFTDPSHF